MCGPRGRVVPAGPVWSGPAREEVRKVTPEPESLHGDFPENWATALLASNDLRSYAPTHLPHPPCCWKPGIGTGTTHRTDSGRQYSLRINAASRIAVLVRGLPVNF